MWISARNPGSAKSVPDLSMRLPNRAATLHQITLPTTLAGTVVFRARLGSNETAVQKCARYGQDISALPALADLIAYYAFLVLLPRRD